MECERCSTEFNPRHKLQRFCSSICREKTRYENRSREAFKVYSAKYRDKTKEKQRDYHLKRNFGITTDQYDTLLEKQNSVCAVCKQPEKVKNRRLAVDHDHVTGEIFGLLCWRCNHRLIGRNRNPDLFYNASVYLRQGTGFIVPKKKPKRKGKRRSQRT